MTENPNLEEIVAKAKSFVSPIELTEVITAIDSYSSIQELDKLIPLFDALRKNDKIDTALIKMALGYSVKTYLEKETDDFENYLKCAMDIFQIASGGSEINYWRFYKERNSDEAKEDRSVFALRANKVGDTFKRDLDITTASAFLKSIKSSKATINLLPEEIGYNHALDGTQGIYLPVNIHLKSNSKPSFFGVIEILNKEHFSERDLEIANYFCKTQFSKEISRYFNERRDELTRLYTRKATKDLILSEVKRSVKSEKPVSVIMSDIDKFKDINDNRGHDGGDYVLSRYSELLWRQ